ncbi:type II secretion system minor pseudopilin GspH [Glaciecola petra]|uniref:Type II secretion system protein H n=1 Tax=Glaciecola petra TaxID=3075602 RepID=A0ABU2ZRE5_9ALTE|nr:type II secretion system minor pseudopilin GspH [Aestuariibacter sp. P117]MDT0595202.1 type II secretion system minor pseudopilin GspH [Aestuariibacter sp. P117]
MLKPGVLRTPEGGFTLLEVILVMAIIGLVMATVQFTIFSKDISREIEKETQRLQALFSLASDYAVINQLEMGLRIDDEEQTYEFVKLSDDEKWLAMDDQEHFALYQLPEGLSLELTLEGLSWQEDEGLFDNRIFDEELSVSSDGVQIGNEEDEEPDPPQIFILSSGEITPFELRLDYQGQDFDEESFSFLLKGIDTVPLVREGPI